MRFTCLHPPPANKHPATADSSDDDDEDEDGGPPGSGGGGGGGGIHDATETNLVNLRRTIYLTLMSSFDFEEAGHKLLKIGIQPGQVRCGAVRCGAVRCGAVRRRGGVRMGEAVWWRRAVGLRLWGL